MELHGWRSIVFLGIRKLNKKPREFQELHENKWVYIYNYNIYIYTYVSSLRMISELSWIAVPTITEVETNDTLKDVFVPLTSCCHAQWTHHDWRNIGKSKVILGSIWLASWVAVHVIWYILISWDSVRSRSCAANKSFRTNLKTMQFRFCSLTMDAIFGQRFMATFPSHFGPWKKSAKLL